jgi:uncharacterized membrane protein
VIPILYIVGAGFGLATALNFGFNLLAPWLVIAYVLWTAAMANGGAIHRPFADRIMRVASAAPDGAISGELALTLADRRERVAEIADYVIIIAILFDMVVKPFS